MKKLLISLAAALFLLPTAASAKWQCTGPSYACNSNSYSAKPKKRKVYGAKPHKSHFRKAKKTYKKRYTKKRTYKKYSVRSGSHSLQGLASYYWQPQGIACGKGRFNPNALTAAHKTLPCGTTVRVTNKRNGKSVTVKINDRGPYIKGRIIDLSKRAAQIISMTNAGVVPVSVTVLR